jgi:glutathionyl-hydroquinone reductase
LPAHGLPAQLFTESSKDWSPPSLSVVDPYMRTFSEKHGCIPDPIFNARYLYEIYIKADPRYTGRVTVPVLWDKQRGTIVNNESAEIIRMLNSEFDAIANGEIDFHPPELRGEIDAINDFIYTDINKGVYRCGFATTQEAYEEAFTVLFAALDRLEGILEHEPYLTGGRITEVDWRSSRPLRFDAVYYGHFKCNLKRIAEYPNLSRYLRELYRVPGIAETVDMDHIKRHYYQSNKTINPIAIVLLGPVLEFMGPDR